MGEWRSKTTEAETEHSSQDQTALSDSRLLPAMQTDRQVLRQELAPRLPPRARRGVPATPAMIWGVWWRQEEDWFTWSLSTQLPGVPGHEQALNRSRARLWPLAPVLADSGLLGCSSERQSSLHVLSREGQQLAIPESFLKRTFLGPQQDTHANTLRNQMKFRAFIGSKSLSLSEMKLYKFIHMVKILAAS